MERKYCDGFFDISPEYGFLPTCQTLEHLPEEFKELDNVCFNLPLVKKDLRLGTLHFYGAIESEIAKVPNYLKVLEEKEFEVVVYQSLYRNYCFLVSSYCLEPTYKSYIETRTYAKGRTVVPENIAVPFCFVAKKLGVTPWLEYHYSYILGNLQIVNKRENSEDYELEDLRTLSLFCGDLDEINFIRVHQVINLCTPELIEGIFKTHEGLKVGSSEKVSEGLKKVHDTVIKMNEKRRLMWGNSDQKRYGSYRIFLMGITGNDAIFDEGVLYSGVSEERVKYRGETGAQDDIIPTLDTFTRVIDFYPDNMLTKYLQDMRQYRPQVVISFLKDLEQMSQKMEHRALDIGGVSALVYLAAIVNQIYNFRNGHWQFVQKYIMRNTTYNVATGGTPLNNWLPNQIKACLMKVTQLLNFIEKVSSPTSLSSMSHEVRSLYDALVSEHQSKIDLLNEQMTLLGLETYNIEQVIKLDDRQG